MKVIEQIEKFGEERGGICLADLWEYSIEHNKRWCNYIESRTGIVRVGELLRQRGWDDSISKDDIDGLLSEVASYRGLDIANQLASEIYRSRIKRSRL